MLSLFPQLFTYVLVVPFLFRLTLAGLALVGAKRIYKSAYPYVAFVYALTGISLLLGAYTQAGEILAILLVAFEYWLSEKNGTSNDTLRTLYKVVAVIALSLLFLGPGFLAFDLPL